MQATSVESKVENGKTKCRVETLRAKYCSARRRTQERRRHHSAAAPLLTCGEQSRACFGPIMISRISEIGMTSLEEGLNHQNIHHPGRNICESSPPFPHAVYSTPEAAGF
eukprot:2445395-Pleurochrysis_carterae.AAC.3